jgi:hypothetical protein
VVALCCLAGAVVLTSAGCSAGTVSIPVQGSSSETSGAAGAHMAGPAATVHISEAAIAAMPQALDLKTPESTVRSYLDWTSYAYRIAQSDVASSTMGSKESVRVDSYIQYNIEKKQILDEKLTSLMFGTPSTTPTSVLVPAKEQWTYNYLSINLGNPVVAGPYNASYDSTYTVVKAKSGNGWVVDSVKATALGTVK